MKRYFAFFLCFLCVLCTFFFCCSAETVNVNLISNGVLTTDYGLRYKVTSDLLTKATNTTFIGDTFNRVLLTGSYLLPNNNIPRQLSAPTIYRDFMSKDDLSIQQGIETWLDSFTESFYQDGKTPTIPPEWLTYDENLLPSYGAWLNSYSTYAAEFTLDSNPALTTRRWFTITGANFNEYPSMGYSDDGVNTWYVANFGETLSLHYRVCFRQYDNMSNAYFNAERFSCAFTFTPYSGGIASETADTLLGDTKVVVGDTLLDEIGRKWIVVDFYGSFSFDFSNPAFSDNIPLGVNNYRFTDFRIDWNLGRNGASVANVGNKLMVAPGFLRCEKLDQNGLIIPPTDIGGIVQDFGDVLANLSNMADFGDELSLSGQWYQVLWRGYNGSVKAISGFINSFFDRLPILANLIYSLLFIGVFGVLLGSTISIIKR